MATEHKDTRQLMDEELQTRLQRYDAEVKPGSKDSPIKPMTFKHFLPALICSIILTIFLIIGMVAFSALYP